MLSGVCGGQGKLRFEKIVGVYTEFLFLDKEGLPKVAMHGENRFNYIVKRYNDIFRVRMSHITPQVFRHTFCANMVNAGMDIKTSQYVMGHSDVGVTLNVYTHASYDREAEQMEKIIDLSEQRGRFIAYSGI